MPEPRSESDRELVISHVFDAPRELVFAAWTSADHLPRWYGPRGFTTTIHEMDARAGGTTKLTMHGPDGANYPNTIVYREVVAPERLVYGVRGGLEGAAPSEHLHVVTFEPHGAGTKLTMRLEFASAAAKSENIARYRSDVGGRETLERLGAHVAEMTFVVDPDRPRIAMTRVFDAPPMLVFATLVTREHLARWWGPRGHTLVGCDLDVRPGGAYRFVLRSPDGREHPFAGEFREVMPPRTLAMTMRYDLPAYAKYVSTVRVTLTDFGTRTLLELVEEFATMAERDGKVASGMKGGAVDSHARLGELLDDLVVRGTELELQRTFAAPRALVWDAFTKPEHVKRWLAPPPLTMSVFTVDLRPGGAIEMVMRAPDGSEFPSSGTVREIVPRERFAWRGTIHGGIDVDTVVTFADEGANTRITVRQTYSRVGLPTMGAKMGWLASLDAVERVIRSLV